MNLGFNFDTGYCQSTSKQNNLPHYKASEDDFTKEELIKLLAHLEGDLEAKEDAIARLKTERTRLLLHDAKYGRLSSNDPMMALKRDSQATEETLDEKTINELYESQLVQLERLISVQRKSHHKARAKLIQLLTATEKRHARQLRELELEKERKSRYAAQGDDVLAFLEKERNKLTEQLDFQMGEVARSKQEQTLLESKLENEKERNKTMVLFLMNERKQLVTRLHELRIKSEEKPEAPAATQELVDELKKEVTFLRQERDSLKSANKTLKFQSENLNLKEVVKGQEKDMTMLKKLSTGKHSDRPNTALPPLVHNGGSLVMANRMAGSSPAPTTSSSSAPSTSRSRISNSNSFPTEKSRLPRAPSGHASPRAPASPVKKVPAMGVATTTMRRAPATNSAGTFEPELAELDAAIKSMTQAESESQNVAPTSPTKRSSSLPRGTTGKSHNGSRIAGPTGQVKTTGDGTVRRVATITQSSTVRRNGLSALTKAFGK